jgi:tetratricopeptide (TPR) repeat protein
MVRREQQHRQGTSLNQQYLADDLAHRARLMRAHGDQNAAIELYQQALHIREKALPGTEYDVYDELGQTLFETGDYDDAIECFRSAAEIVGRQFYKEHPLVTHILDHWAEALINSDHLEEAESLIKRSLDIKQKSILLTDADTLETMRMLSEVERKLGNFEEAEKILKKAIAIVEPTTIGPTEEFIYELALVYLAQGRLEDAATELKKALSIFACRAGKNRRYAVCLNTYANVLGLQGHTDEAELLIKDATAILANTEGSPELPENQAHLPHYESGLYPVTILH